MQRLLGISECTKHKTLGVRLKGGILKCDVTEANAEVRAEQMSQVT